MTASPRRADAPVGGALVRSAAYLAAFAALYAAAVLTPSGQAWDAASLGVFAGFGEHSWMSEGGVRDDLTLIVLALALVAAIEGAWRRRWRRVVAAAGLVAATAVAGRVLKDVLPRPSLGEYGYAYQTFPSGHAAVCLAAVIAIVWLGPSWMRPFVRVLLGVVAFLVALWSLLSHAHRASDVVAGVLLTGVLAEVLGVCAREPAPSSGRGRRPRLAGLVGGMIGVAFLLPGFALGAVPMSLAVGIVWAACVAALIVSVLGARSPLPARVRQRVDA